jgi:glycosyltransferase involved in cell wall biosynthesis
VLLTVHNVTPHEASWLNRLMLRFVLMFGHEYIVHSEDNRARLEEMRGSQASVLPHGVLEAPRSGLTKEEARQKLGIAPEAKVALAFGNIRPYKGVDVLLRSFAKIAHEQPNALLVIAGKPWEKWDRYDALIKQMHLADRVRLFLDFVPTPEVETFFTAADAVVLPYRGFDAQSGVGALALPFGRAIIVSAAGGLPEFVFDPDAVVTPGDEESLAESLGRVLRDDAWRHKLEQDSEMIAARLGWTEIAEQTVAIYRAMAGRAETLAAVTVPADEHLPVEAGS